MFIKVQKLYKSNKDLHLKNYDNMAIFGTSVLNQGAGFLRIFTVAFDRLG